MKKQIYDEKNGLSYTLHGDYYLPDLEINEEEPTYGKYGIMRKQFLKEHRNARYQYLVLTGKLTEHLNQVDKEVREKVEMLMEQMVEHWGVTEELKMKDQMEWVRRMNNIKNAAALIILPITDNSFLPTFADSFTIKVERTSITTIPARFASDIAETLPK